MRYLTWVFLSFALLLSGCFRLEVVHQMNFYGAADRGGYRFSVLRSLHNEDPSIIGNALEHLERFSSPEFSRNGEWVTLEDLSGSAQMEWMYDDFDCDPVAGSGGLYDCHFRMTGEDLTFAGWAVVWRVILLPGMEIMQSNHHSISRTDDNLRMLEWDIDGDQVNRFTIDFTLRVPSF